MGYSNQTPNFGLPQYAMGDIPTMDDYNRSFRVIDEFLGQGTGGGAVESVNGQTGAVVLDAEDVGAISNTAGAVQTDNIADKSITAEKLSDDIVISGGGGGSAVILNDLTIAPESFTAYTAENTEEQKLIELGYSYRATMTVTGATEKMSPTVTFSLADIKKAGVTISNQFKCYNGGFYIYSNKVPAESITVLTLALHGGEDSGGEEEGGNCRCGNENLLDNWYFLPAQVINQKGITVDTVFNTAGAYFIDRWILVSGSVTLTAAGLVLNGTIRQKREFALGTDDFTASVFAVSGTATAEYDDSLKYFDIASEGGTISAAKLELGSRQTLIKEDETLLNDPPPDYGTELAKCQRYMIAFTGTSTWSGYVRGLSQITSATLLPVTLRAIPRVTIEKLLNLRGVNGSLLGDIIVNSATVSSMAGTSLQMFIDIPENTNLTDGTPVMLHAVNMILDANL